MYPQLYEGQECTEHLFCTGPTPFQQISELIPFLIKKGNKRFAMPSANYRCPQLLNKWTRNAIEENGGEVVLEEYFPLDQMEYSATVGKIIKEKVDHVFNTIIPPGLAGFTKQLYESGMVIGSHSVNHKLMSKLTGQEFKKEIDESFDFLKKYILFKTFCYPYGGFHSFTRKVEQYLTDKSVLFSLNVERRAIDYNDLKNRRQALPRFDCNEFCYGKIDVNN